MPEYIIGIDPGNKASAFVLMDAKTLRPLACGKNDNELMYCDMVSALTNAYLNYGVGALHYAVEMIASYGMPVGAEVFDTCRWIGTLEERLKSHDVRLIYRKDEKLTLCKSMKATDATIKQALIDRFAKGEKNYGKGTKAAPGWFYGFRADVWQAYAVGVTYADMIMMEKLEARKHDTETKNH